MQNPALLKYLDGLSHEEFVLHGGPVAAELLLPAAPDQGHLIPEYDRPAVYGSCLVGVALLYAVIRTPSADWGWRVILEPPTPHIRVIGPAHLHIGTGYIHVLRRSDFADFVLDGLVALAYAPVAPVKTFRVLPNILELLIQERRIRVQSYEEFKVSGL